MKFKIILLSLLTLLLASCDKDPIATNSSFNLDSNNLQGNINDGVVVLKSDQIYKLTGPLIVNSGAELRIECGVKIIAQTALGADSLYIKVNQGAKINAIGTATCPIIFTSTDTLPGSWGGIMINGKAPHNINNGALSDLFYLNGNNDPNDNSGSLKYTIIKFSGSSSRIGIHERSPGLSLNGVGSGTIIEYIAILNTSSDGLMINGGTVNCNYIYIENIQDDALDICFGYTGNISYLYSKTNFDYFYSTDSRGIELENNSYDKLSNPFTKSTIKHVTLIGRGSYVISQKEAIMYKDGAGSILNNIFIQGYPVGIRLYGQTSIDRISTNDLKISNVQFIDVPENKKTWSQNIAAQIVDVSSAISEGITNGAGSISSVKPSWASFVK